MRRCSKGEKRDASLRRRDAGETVCCFLRSNSEGELVATLWLVHRVHSDPSLRGKENWKSSAKSVTGAMGR